jgi:hypothetical protein
VIGRLYAIIILVLFWSGSFVYVYKRPYTIHHSMFDKPEGQEPMLIASSWKDYLEDCSGAKIIENQVHAAHQDSLKYKENIVNWDGYFIDFKGKINSAYMSHGMSILVKMNPSESETFADIVLSISKQTYKINKDTIDGLKKGDHVNFKANIMSMGNEFKLHHLKLADEEDSLEDTGQTPDYDHIEIQTSEIKTQ